MIYLSRTDTSPPKRCISIYRHRNDISRYITTECDLNLLQLASSHEAKQFLLVVTNKFDPRYNRNTSVFNQQRYPLSKDQKHVRFSHLVRSDNFRNSRHNRVIIRCLGQSIPQLS
jgi:hypothetical protein